MKRGKSVMKTSAQFAELCSRNNRDFGSNSFVKVWSDFEKQQLGRYFFVALIQERSGSRISEVLQISWKDIVNSEQILIKGNKGSRSKIVFVPEMREKLVKCVEFRFDPFKGMNRFSAYRLYKKLGIFIEKEGNKNLAVTHSFRNKYARQIAQISDNEKEIQDAIGHNSIKSQKYYTENGRKSS